MTFSSKIYQVRLDKHIMSTQFCNISGIGLFKQILQQTLQLPHSLVISEYIICIVIFKVISIFIYEFGPVADQSVSSPHRTAHANLSIEADSTLPPPVAGLE